MTCYKMLTMRFISCILILGFTIHSTEAQISTTKILAKNTLEIARLETIEIPFSKLDPMFRKKADRLVVREMNSKKVLRSQLVDLNSDGISDQLVFQSRFGPKQEIRFSIELTSEKLPKDTSTITTFARLVPERIDDFAWENDKVAFRTYGPEAQRLTESNLPNGTLSSGIDCWLKRVEYPIINKWYKKYVEGGSYHKDDGEGYDPYHVGKSRGCGGIGILMNDSLYVSKNFVSAKIIANGPIRTIFELQYASWNSKDNSIIEKKRITIDLGSQMYRSEIELTGSKPINECSIGLTLHDKKGETTVDSIHGFVSYWESIDDSMLGTGILASPKNRIRIQENYSDKKDQSHLFLLLKPDQGKLTYYAGYGWKKAGVFKTLEDWIKYLEQESNIKSNPLKILLF